MKLLIASVLASTAAAFAPAANKAVCKIDFECTFIIDHFLQTKRSKRFFEVVNPVE